MKHFIFWLLLGILPVAQAEVFQPCATAFSWVSYLDEHSPPSSTVVAVNSYLRTLNNDVFRGRNSLSEHVAGVWHFLLFKNLHTLTSAIPGAQLSGKIPIVKTLEISVTGQAIGEELLADLVAMAKGQAMADLAQYVFNPDLTLEQFGSGTLPLRFPGNTTSLMPISRDLRLAIRQAVQQQFGSPQRLGAEWSKNYNVGIGSTTMDAFAAARFSQSAPSGALPEVLPVFRLQQFHELVGEAFDAQPTVQSFFGSSGVTAERAFVWLKSYGDSAESLWPQEFKDHFEATRPSQLSRSAYLTALKDYRAVVHKFHYLKSEWVAVDGEMLSQIENLTRQPNETFAVVVADAKNISSRNLGLLHQLVPQLHETLRELASEPPITSGAAELPARTQQLLDRLASLRSEVLSPTNEYIKEIVSHFRATAARAGFQESEVVIWGSGDDLLLVLKSPQHQIGKRLDNMLQGYLADPLIAQGTRFATRILDMKPNEPFSLTYTRFQMGAALDFLKALERTGVQASFETRLLGGSDKPAINIRKLEDGQFSLLTNAELHLLSGMFNQWKIMSVHP